MVRTAFVLFLGMLFAAPCVAADEYQSLFNGKDLTGWAGDPELWSVEDGVITGRTKGPDHLPHNKFLIWEGGTLGDFELHLEFRLEGNNNSGVQYRSMRLPDAGEWVVKGYQADIHANAPYTGMLYDERGRGIIAQRGQRVVVDAKGKKNASKLDVPVTPVDLTEWHTLSIIARGNEIVHKLDGVTTVEIVDEQESEREMEGILALQVHRGPAMTVQFRNIRLKQLGGKTPAAKQTSKAPSGPRWIWLNDGNDPASAAYFRKEFRVKGSVAAARLLVACDNSATVFVDGQRVLQHNSFETPKYADVTKLLSKETPGGKHVIAVEAKNSGGPGGLLVQLVMESGWRNSWNEVTGDDWQAALKPARGWKAPGFKASGWQQPAIVAELGAKPWDKVTEEALAKAASLKEPVATPVESIRVAKGFKAELLYSVPKDEEGSWVSMCVDPKGRLIVCDQYGGLFRVKPELLADDANAAIEKIQVDIGEAQGLLWAFDSLYVSVNTGGKYKSGLYRVRDTDGDDQLDSVETIRLLDGGGEHGPHALRLSPDGKSLYLVCGNKTKLTEFVESRVPELWDEDNLIPRAYGRGFMKGVPAPGGYVCKMDPDGKEWELVTTGFRNPYDIAFNADGELFTYDADMEWDMNTPWYRPTRVCQVLSGVDYGWRNGGGKFMEFFADTLPPVVNIGPGSPTGIEFGYGAKFPAKYQQALFINDWSYGKLYAVHLAPEGATYGAQVEEFITGTPLPLTDIVVNPHDGAMYFAIGGRRVQSGLYRVTYTGEESTAPVAAENSEGRDARQLRQELESLHVGDHPDAVERAWPYLSHEDRVIRTAARIAIEHRPREEWQSRALDETNTQASLEALLALARSFERLDKNPAEAVDTPVPTWTESSDGPEGERGEIQEAILMSLDRIDPNDLSVAQKLHAARVVALTMLRLGQPSTPTRDGMIAALEPMLPSGVTELDLMLLELLVYLQAPQAAEKGVALLSSAPTQEEQIALAKTLRHLQAGWTDETRAEYFRWFVKAAGYRGGASFTLFVQNIKNDAVSYLTEDQQLALKPILEAKPEGQVSPLSAEPRPFVKDWTMDELLPLVQNSLSDRDFDRGRKMFAAANCYGCHRFNNEGGAVGPDLSGLAGRFSPRDMLEAIIEPSKVISDQYAAVQIITVDGRVIVGRIVNLAGDSFRVNTNMLDPDAQESVDRKTIEEMIPSKTSMMPKGLLNTLSEDEVLDLMAYLLSRGDRSHPMFQAAAGD